MNNFRAIINRCKLQDLGYVGAGDWGHEVGSENV